MSTAAPAKRNRQWVDREVQGGVLGKIAVHWVLFFVVNAIALTVWIRMFEQPDVAWGQTFADTVRRFFPFFVISVALLPAFVWDTLKLTNRFAGPMSRMRQGLANARAGKPVSPIKFRDGDFWKDVAEDFNAVVATKPTVASEAVADA